jgi:hypothetical protein
MKTFNEWLIEKDPEFLDEGVGDFFRNAAKVAVPALAFAAGASGVVAPTVAQGQDNYHIAPESKVPFDLLHTIRVLKLSTKWINDHTDTDIYNMLIRRTCKLRIEDPARYSDIQGKYKEPDSDNPGKYVCHPPAFKEDQKALETVAVMIAKDLGYDNVKPFWKKHIPSSYVSK